MNQRFFIIGALLLLIGAQLRFVDSFVLTPRATQFIQSKMRSAAGPGRANYGGYDSLLLSSGPRPKKTLTPPKWCGWAALSVGGVLVLHGLTMRRHD